MLITINDAVDFDNSKSFFEEIFNAEPGKPFDDFWITFINDFVLEISNYSELKKYGDLVALANWCKNFFSEDYFSKKSSVYKNRVARGTVFHIPPNNVPTNLAYSFFAGLITGNRNLIRLPSSSAPQIEFIIETLNKLFEKRYYVARDKFFCAIKYQKERTITDFLSFNCDRRVIWGGDMSIKSVRESSLNPMGNDIVFPDRYSFSIINAEEYNASNQKKQLALRFYNDVFIFDQNACTAPHLVIWLGNKKTVSSAAKAFWELQEKVVSKKYELPPNKFSEKLALGYKYAAMKKDLRTRIISQKNIVRVQLGSIDKKIDSFKLNCGLFFEYTTDDINDLKKFVNKRYQTLSYFGFHPEKIRNDLLNMQLPGIDRIVPIGSTLDFDLIWDGKDLISELTRIVNV